MDKTLDEVLRRSHRTPGDIEADVIRKGGTFDVYGPAEPGDAAWPPSPGGWPW